MGVVLERAKIVSLCQLQLYVELSRSALDFIAVDVVQFGTRR